MNRIIINKRIVTGIFKIDKNLFVLLPNIYIQYELKDIYSDYHYFTLEFRMMFLGLGIKFSWKNKNVKPLPESHELFL